MSKKADGWVEPNQSDRYLCDDGIVRTWLEITKTLDADSHPKDRKDYELLLWSFGVKKAYE